MGIKNAYFSEERFDDGPECIGYSEIDKYANRIYQSHFPTHKNYGDITRINAKDLPAFDLIVGGFPCQSFSAAGKRKGFNDTRGTMFFELARIIREKQPRLLCFENVKGLLSHDQGNTFFTTIQTLNELGYDCEWQVLNSKNHGVPQNRERLFVIGYLRGTRRPEVFPFGEGSKNTTGSDREDSSVCTPTITTQGGKNCRGMFIEQLGRVRRLTPIECERLQGFPDNWTKIVSDTQRYKTLGNAVTVTVIMDIFRRLLSTECQW